MRRPGRARQRFGLHERSACSSPETDESGRPRWKGVGPWRRAVGRVIDMAIARASSVGVPPRPRVFSPRRSRRSSSAAGRPRRSPSSSSRTGSESVILPRALSLDWLTGLLALLAMHSVCEGLHGSTLGQAARRRHGGARGRRERDDPSGARAQRRIRDRPDGLRPRRLPADPALPDAPALRRRVGGDGGREDRRARAVTPPLAGGASPPRPWLGLFAAGGSSRSSVVDDAYRATVRRRRPATPCGSSRGGAAGRAARSRRRPATWRCASTTRLRSAEAGTLRCLVAAGRGGDGSGGDAASPSARAPRRSSYRSRRPRRGPGYPDAPSQIVVALFSAGQRAGPERDVLARPGPRAVGHQDGRPSTDACGSHGAHFLLTSAGSDFDRRATPCPTASSRLSPRPAPRPVAAGVNRPGQGEAEGGGSAPAGPPDGEAPKRPSRRRPTARRRPPRRRSPWRARRRRPTRAGSPPRASTA